MSDTNREPPPETVSVEVHHDRLCDRYEFLRKAGQPVTVGAFLRMEGIDPAAADSALVRGLEALAVWYRPGNEPTVVLPADATPDAAETLPEIRPGAVLGGRYELIELIGKGGMGEVWRAHQTSPMSRMVAVKVIRERPGQDSRAILARFEAERQTLALMDHPNIARVLDAGTTDDGRPFFVMDLIKGVPITAFCDARRLSPKERLELFVPVCRAIQHAHQKGILHRDIKPDNVLVALHDDRPVPVVIDFGIAKAFGQALTVESVATGHWAIVGTPEYMSPEQATPNQLDIDTRSDVYSLGVLLYELLTGTTPVDRQSLGNAALLEVLRIVREVEAPRPSHRLSSSTLLADIATKRSAEPTRLGRQYRNELDWVLLKALEKDRCRRYESANAFAADIERHLANELVEATPPTRGYRLRKFYHRHRPQVIAASLVFVALVAGVVGTTVGLLEALQARADEAERADGERQAKEEAEIKRIEAVEQRRRAELATAAERQAKHLAAAEAKKAREAEDATLADFRATTSEALTNLLAKDAELSSGAKIFLTDLLKRWEGFSQRVGDDLRSRVIRAEGFLRVSTIQSLLGSGDLALVNLRGARTILEAVLVDEPNSVEAMELLAYVVGDLSEFRSTQSRAEELRSYQTVMQLWQEVVRRKPADKSYQYMIAYTHLKFGGYHLESRDMPLAEAEFRKSRVIGEQLLRDDGKQVLYLDMLISCGLFQAQCRNFGNKDPIAAYEDVLTKTDAALVVHPDRVSFLQAKRVIHENLGKALLVRGKGEQALWHYEQVRDVAQRFYLVSPGIFAYRVGVHSARNRVASVLASLKRFDEAKGHFLAVIDGLSEILEKHPRNGDLLREAIRGRGNFAMMLEEVGETQAAIEQYRRTVRLGRELLSVESKVPLDHTLQIDAMRRLAKLLDRQGFRDEWRRQLEDTREYLLEPIRLFPGHVLYMDHFTEICGTLLPIYWQTRSHEESRKCYRALLRVSDEYCRDKPKDFPWKTDAAIMARNYGTFLREIGQNEESLKWLGRAIDALVEMRDGPSRDPRIVPRLMISYVDRAILQQNRERYVEALKDWADAITLSERSERPFLRASSVLALARSGRVNEALTEIQKLESLAKWPGHIWYEFAAASAIAADAEGRDEEKQRLIKASVDHFTKAVRTDVANARQRRPKSDFATLKDDDDFRKLAEQWAKKYPPEVAPAPTAVKPVPELAPAPRPAK